MNKSFGLFVKVIKLIFRIIFLYIFCAPLNIYLYCLDIPYFKRISLTFYYGYG